MPAAMLTPDTPPPEDYYQNNCLTLFNFVLRHYETLLPHQVKRQLELFMLLSVDAQRLFARLLTRKGPLLRVDALNYVEVADLEGALAELTTTHFIRRQPQAPADRLLNLLRKNELTLAFTPAVPKSLKKADMIDLLCGRYSDLQIYTQLTKFTAWLRIADAQIWWLVRLLYFGDRAQDWSAFVIRDLGMVRYEQFPMGSKRFNHPEDLALDLYYRQLSHLSRRVDEHPGLAQELVATLQERVEERFICARRNRALLRIGQWCERQEAHEVAVRAYAAVEQHPARERIVRVLHKSGRTADAERWLANIKQAPLCDEERQFVQRFGKRQAGYQPPTTYIDIECARTDIEQQALELILAPGEWGLHVENSLVRTLTGLMYWSVLFADVPGAFTNPFQFGPNDLYAEDFALVRQELIAEVEAVLGDDDALRAHLLKVMQQKNGIANSLVNWRLFDEFSLDDFLNALPFDDIRKLCGFLIRNLYDRKAGLPDLLVVHGYKNYELVEVKGPNDQLQPGQRVWFKHLKRLDIPARVVKLRIVR